MNKVGPTIRSIREVNQWTQEQLVARCHLVGWDISRSTLAKIESQVRRVTDDEVVLIAKALDIPIQKLFDSEV